MTTLREAAQQALEVLEVQAEGAEEECGEETCRDCQAWRPVWVAITALKAVLEQPERAQAMRNAGYTRRPTLREMSEEEPVVLMDAPLLLNGQPLFTHPPRREWRGLTYQEIDDLQSGMQATFKDICAIEAALKEKNHE